MAEQYGCCAYHLLPPSLLTRQTAPPVKRLHAAHVAHRTVSHLYEVLAESTQGDSACCPNRIPNSSAGAPCRGPAWLFSLPTSLSSWCSSATNHGSSLSWRSGTSKAACSSWSGKTIFPGCASAARS